MKQSCLIILIIVLYGFFSCSVAAAAGKEERIKSNPPSRTPPASSSQRTPDDSARVPAAPEAAVTPAEVPTPKSAEKSILQKSAPAPKRKSIAITGFCCKDGEIHETTREDCRRKHRGIFFSDRKTAESRCRGWCCRDFGVLQTTARQCEADRSRFFGTRSAAERFCEALPGWCCVEGTIQRLNRDQCERRHGSFATSSAEAFGSCRKPNTIEPSAERPTLAPIPEPAPGPPPPPDWPPLEWAQLAPAETLQQRSTDLAILDFALIRNEQEVSSVRLGHYFSYRVTIKNVGGRGQPADSPVAYFELFLSDFPPINYQRTVIAPFSLALPPLDAGEEYTIYRGITIPRVVQNQPLQPGTYVFNAAINTSGGYQPEDELNQQNNHLTRRFEVRDPSPADLAVAGLSLTEDCRLRIRLENSGSAIDTADYDLARIRVEKEREIATTSTPSGSYTQKVHDQKVLATADSNGWLKNPVGALSWATVVWPAVSSLSANWSISLGPGESAVYIVTVDPYSAVYDSNRANNSRTASLTCPD